MQSNAAVTEFWKCEYGHGIDLRSAPHTPVGTCWSASREQAVAGAVARAKTAMKALRILLIARSTGDVWRWRVWAGDPEMAWPPAEIARKLREADADDVVYQETTGIHDMLDLADEFDV